VKLIGYELLKLYEKKWIWLVLSGVLLLNGYLYIQQQMSVNGYLIENREAYHQLEHDYRSMKPEDALNESVRLVEELNSYSLLQSAAAHPDMMEHNFELLSLLEKDPALIGRFQESAYVDDAMLLYRDLFLNQLIRSEYADMMQYPNFIQGLQDNADQMLNVSIFREEGGFSKRNIIRTVEAFAGLDRLPLKSGLGLGISSATTFVITDVALMAVILLLCAYVLMSDRDTNVVGLVRSNKNGRLPVIIAKLTTLCLVSLTLSLLFYGSVLLISEHLYGFGDMSRYVQSISEFQQANTPFTVSQYLGAFLLGKTVVCLLAAMLCGLFFVCFSHVVKSYLALAGFLTISGACYTFIHPQSPLNLLKYMNLIAYFDTFDILGRYRNLNVFGFPVNRLHASALGIFISLLVLPVVSAVVSANRYPTRALPFFLEFWERIRRRAWKTRLSIHLFAHEWFKSLFTTKGYIILLVALLIGLNRIEHDEVRYHAEDAQYLEYYRVVSGPLNEEKSRYLEAEKASFDQLAKRVLELEDIYSAGEISRTDYLQRKAELGMFSQQRKAFDRIYGQYNDLRQLQSSDGINGSFINEINASYLFDRPMHDLLYGLLHMTLTVMLTSAIFPIDARKGMASVLRSTLKGRIPLYVSKVAVGCCSVLILMALLYIPLYINVFTYFDLEYWKAPIQSVGAFRQFPLHISIREFILMAYTLQYASVLMAVQAIFYFSQLAKRQSLSLLLNSALFISPMVMQLAGLDTVRKLSFNNAYLPFATFANVGGIGGTALYYGCLFVIGIAAALLSWRRFINQTESRRRGFDAVIYRTREQELR